MAAGKGNRIKELLFTKFTHHKHFFCSIVIVHGAAKSGTQLSN